MKIATVLISVIGLALLAGAYWMTNASDELSDAHPLASTIPGQEPSLVANGMKIEPTVEALSAREIDVPQPTGATSVQPRHEPDPSDPYRSPFNLGIEKLQDVTAGYASNIEAARKGDGEAMREIARVMRNCEHAWSIGDAESAMRYYEDGTLTLYEYEETLPQIEECESIWNDQQNDWASLEADGYRGSPKRLWLGRASAAGNKSASVEYLFDLPGQNEKLASLLDELVDSRDPHVLDAAAGFVALRATPESINETYKWEYLSCLSSLACDDSLFEATLRVYHTQGVADEIVEFGKSYTSREEMGFSFVTMNASQAYTAYTLAEIKAYTEALFSSGKPDLEGVEALVAVDEVLDKSEPKGSDTTEAQE